MPAQTISRSMVTTALELPGYRAVRNLGVVRGLTVRSRSVIGNIGAGLQTLFGGNITILADPCEHAREEAFEIMLAHASGLGANAIIAAQYDATEIMNGVTEVLAYGTAVVVEPVGEKSDDGRRCSTGRTADYAPRQFSDCQTR